MTSAPTYMPKNDWLYTRIYTGHRSADRILAEILFPLWRMYNRNDLSDRWFFIRYADPDFHLRFRIQMKTEEAGFEFFQLLRSEMEPLMKAGLVWNMEVGTYNQETERYGSHSMAAAEQIFFADSLAMAEALQCGVLELE